MGDTHINRLYREVIFCFGQSQKRIPKPLPIGVTIVSQCVLETLFPSLGFLCLHFLLALGADI